MLTIIQRYYQHLKQIGRPAAPTGGMRAFFVIWFGQLVSMTGTFMTNFALIIWAYDQSGDATTIALLGFFLFGAKTLFSPLAGLWVDRVDRRAVLIGVDVAAGVITVSLLGLYQLGELSIWHLYLAQFLDGALSAFHYPAYTAIISVMLPGDQYTRANGLRALARYTADIGAPVLAGVLLVLVGLSGIMLIDLGTFGIAMLTLAVIPVPRPPVEDNAEADSGGFWRRLSYGFRYIFARRGLMGLMFIGTGINLFAALTYFAVLPTMILARTGGDAVALATVQAAMGAGGVIGGVLMSIWGGPHRKIHSALGAAAISFLLGDLLMAVGRDVPVWVASGVIGAVFIPFIVGGNLAIWQIKVPPGIQGRVLAAQAMLRNMTMPLGYLLGGLLADHVFEPAMQPGGDLTGAFGWLVGTGPGAGMALMFVITALAGCAVSALGYLVPSIRHVESDLPDYSLAEAPAQPVEALAESVQPTPEAVV